MQPFSRLLIVFSKVHGLRSAHECLQVDRQGNISRVSRRARVSVDGPPFAPLGALRRSCSGSLVKSFCLLARKSHSFSHQTRGLLLISCRRRRYDDVPTLIPDSSADGALMHSSVGSSGHVVALQQGDSSVATRSLERVTVAAASAGQLPTASRAAPFVPRAMPARFPDSSACKLSLLS